VTNTPDILFIRVKSVIVQVPESFLKKNKTIYINFEQIWQEQKRERLILPLNFLPFI